MTTSTNILIDIDKEFDDVYFDEASINHATSILNRDANPDFHNKRNSSLREVYNDPNWKNNIQKGADKRHADPEWEKAWRESYTPESNNRRSIAMKKFCKDSKVKELRSKNSLQMWQDPERRLKTQKCVKTPLGIFNSCLEAANAHNITKGAFSNLMKRHKLDPAYGYISIEEYIMLTGKDI
jgi:hypothetical protein